MLDIHEIPSIIAKYKENITVYENSIKNQILNEV
jgi:hypothetical protein